MIHRHLALYLAARGVSAVGNLGAIAIFTRLAGPEIYGHYVVMFAAALVLSGFSAQWLRYGFFNLYRSDEDRDFFATFVAMLLVSTLITAGVAFAAFALEGAGAVFAAGAILIGLSTALFEVMNEVCRTRLEAERAASGVILKTVAVLVFGTAALLLHPSALALALGIALAHLAAALPAARTLARLVGGRPTLREAKRLLAFGWPLMLAFGIGAFAQGADRFVLASVGGAAATGAYGALSDLVRASFVILAESISMATVPLAKRQFAAGEREEAASTLEGAFVMLLVVGALLVSGALVFAPVLLPVVFPASFLAEADRILPAVVLAAFLLVVRNVYLAQIIYFARSSWLELASALVLTVVNLALCLLLVPRHGALGAALGFLGGQVAAGLLFLLAGGRDFRMPTPVRPVLLALAGTALLALAGRAIGDAGLPLGATLAAQVALFGAALMAGAALLGLRPRHIARLGPVLKPRFEG